MLLLLAGCPQPWGRLTPGAEGVIVAPPDNRNGQDLTKGLVLGEDMPGDRSPMGARILRVGQPVRVVAENATAAADDRGRLVEVLVLDGPHGGLHVRIRRDQFRPRRGD